ncbi:MAG: methyltransferase domain-containing protein, partial [Gammaproteobacteria bacterium]|nr:methyltransferase domain-containing protein [Gammaproteobacteria bacterium]
MKESVKEYYGKILNGSSDLQTNSCCTDTNLPDHLKQAMSNIHPEVSARYYGCGLIAPQELTGARILDLGSGSGRDCYLLAQLVGEQGSVVGVDMTEEQLEVANRHVEWHRDRFGYSSSNVEFRLGHIERLDELGLEDNSFDIIVSNCVINLSPDKDAVLREAYRLLKPGGELYFSDVYSDRRVPGELQDDPLLYGECLSGALYWNDFLRLATVAGFADPRLVEDRPITIDNTTIEQRIGHINFYSATYRLFKIDGLESACEDYGQAVVYKGGVQD